MHYLIKQHIDITFFYTYIPQNQPRANIKMENTTSTKRIKTFT